MVEKPENEDTDAEIQIALHARIEVGDRMGSGGALRSGGQGGLLREEGI